MRYNIISINNDRKIYKDAIRQHCYLEEIHIPTIDAKEVDILNELAKRGLENRPWSPKIGEMGVWLSNFDCWQRCVDMNESLIVFEDDAIIDESFQHKFLGVIGEVPDDWDFLACWVPENQTQDYLYNVTFDECGDKRILGRLDYEHSLYKHSLRVAKAYQGYGMVSIAYSPQGAQKLIDIVKRTGVYTPVDCFIFQQANLGNLNGFAPTPFFANIVRYDWSAESHVQLTERAII